MSEGTVAVGGPCCPKWVARLGHLWRQASYRGVAVLEMRRDRRSVVHALTAQTIADARGSILLIAADEVTAAKWRRYVATSFGDLLARQYVTIGTARDITDDGAPLGRRFAVVVTDEPETYCDTAFVRVLRTHLGAHLGLCATRSGISDADHAVRQVMGRMLAVDPSGEGATEVAADGVLAWRVELPDLVPDSEFPEAPGDEAIEYLFGTPDAEDLLNIYLRQAQRTPLLTAEEEGLLARSVEAGVLAAKALESNNGLSVLERGELLVLAEEGRIAKERFVLSNLRLVYSIARRYSRRMELIDLVQEGNIGLIRAVEKFDYRRGFKFSTYATWWIRQAITRAIADQELLIRVPVHMREKDARVMMSLQRRTESFDDTSPSAIATELEISTEAVSDAIRRSTPPISLEELRVDVGDVVEDEFGLDPANLLDEWDNKTSADDLLSRLDERGADVIRRRFGFIGGQCQTLEGIASVYCVTRERIRQIEKVALNDLAVLAGVRTGTPLSRRVRELNYFG